MPDRYRVIKSLNLSAAYYHKIGKIMVSANQLESRMRTLPILLVDTERESAWALTAHLNMASLCEMTQAMIRAEHRDAFGDAFVATINRAKAAFDRRSALVHHELLSAERNSPQSVRTTARTQIKHVWKPFPAAELDQTLSDLVTAYSDVEDFARALLVIRGRRTLGRGRSRIRALVRLASLQTP